jgi:flagellar biosynthesis protein FliR
MVLMPESILVWLPSLLVLSARLVPVMVLSPALSSYGVPATVRIALTFMLAALALSGHALPAEAASWVRDPEKLLGVVIGELALGALIGLSVQIALAAFAVAGRVMDVQIGFGLASVFDPTTRSSSSVLGMLLSLVGVMLFIASGTHLELARLVSASLDVFPLGHVPALADPMRAMQAGGLMFSLGLSIAAPLVVTLLLVDIAMAVLSRTMPQLNVLMLGMPLKVGVGFLVLMGALPMAAALARDAFARTARAMGVL